MWWLVALAFAADVPPTPDVHIPVFSVHYATKTKCKVAKHWLAIRRPEVKSACIFFLPTTPTPQADREAFLNEFAVPMAIDDVGQSTVGKLSDGAVPGICAQAGLAISCRRI